MRVGINVLIPTLQATPSLFSVDRSSVSCTFNAPKYSYMTFTTFDILTIYSAHRKEKRKVLRREQFELRLVRL